MSSILDAAFFFIVLGPLIVWITGAGDSGTPPNSPQSKVLDASFTQSSVGY